MIARPLTLFTSLSVIPNGILAFFPPSEAFDEGVEGLSLQLSLSRIVAHMPGAQNKPATSATETPKKRAFTRNLFEEQQIANVYQHGMVLLEQRTRRETVDNE